MGLPADLAETVYARVVAKLEREPVEDFRIDFEDGYGTRPDAEEDHDVEVAAKEVAAGHAAGTLPPFIGIRIKSYSRELHERATRTLDVFLTHLARAGGLPPNFVVTFPKIQHIDQVRVFVERLSAIEKRLGIDRVPIEIMVEQPQTIFTPDGRAALPLIHDACDGRLFGAHFGTYDYTASMGITAAHQHMLHPACDFAKNMMQVAFAGTGVMLSDGATNVMPVGHARDGARRVEASCDARAALARDGVLSGLGFAPRAAPDALRGGDLVLPRVEGRGDRALAEFRREGRAGDARGRRVRRRGDGARSAQLLPPRADVRCADGTRSARHGFDARRASLEELRESAREPENPLMSEPRFPPPGGPQAGYRDAPAPSSERPRPPELTEPPLPRGKRVVAKRPDDPEVALAKAFYPGKPRRIAQVSRVGVAIVVLIVIAWLGVQLAVSVTSPVHRTRPAAGSPR